MEQRCNGDDYLLLRWSWSGGAGERHPPWLVLEIDRGGQVRRWHGAAVDCGVGGTAMVWEAQKVEAQRVEMERDRGWETQDNE
ncbi:Fe-S oxidoreductase [Sesbania bispinosa]|nr:Fe-S oxidoreductase [Sesbania bispinosa]